MLQIPIRWAVVLSFVAIYPASFARTPGPNSEFGCPGPPGNGEVEDLLLLDGKVVDREHYAAVPRSAIGLIEIVCWKKAKELFSKGQVTSEAAGFVRVVDEEPELWTKHLKHLAEQL